MVLRVLNLVCGDAGTGQHRRILLSIGQESNLLRWFETSTLDKSLRHHLETSDARRGKKY